MEAPSIFWPRRTVAVAARFGESLGEVQPRQHPAATRLIPVLIRLGTTIPGAGLRILPSVSHFAFLQDPGAVQFGTAAFPGRSIAKPLPRLARPAAVL